MIYEFTSISETGSTKSGTRPTNWPLSFLKKSFKKISIFLLHRRPEFVGDLPPANKKNFRQNVKNTQYSPNFIFNFKWTAKIQYLYSLSLTVISSIFTTWFFPTPIYQTLVNLDVYDLRKRKSCSHILKNTVRFIIPYRYLVCMNTE